MSNSGIVGAMIIALVFVQVPTHAVDQKAEPQPRTAKQVWSIIKTALMAPDGEEYFENNLKGANVPGGVEGVNVFTGTLLSTEPLEKPSTLVVAISDSTTPEVTLQMKDDEWNDTHINGPLMRGSLIQFEGVVTAFTKKPFMLTLGVSIAPRSHTRR